MKNWRPTETEKSRLAIFFQDPQVLATVETVVGRIAKRYTFGVYDEDDLRSESFLICCEALLRYDGVRPLENFLSANLANRLRNFIRDHHFRISESQSDEANRLASRRKAILEPLLIDCVSDEEAGLTAREEDVETASLLAEFSARLPRELRLALSRLRDGVPITAAKRRALREALQSFLDEVPNDST